MIKKKNLLKNLLATASTMAVLASGIQSASAVSHFTNNDPAASNTAANWLQDDNGTASAAAIAAGDVMYLQGGHDVVIDNDLTGGASLKLMKHDNKTVTISHNANLTLESDGSTDADALTWLGNGGAVAGGNAAAAINIKFGVDAKTLTLADATAVKSINFDDKTDSKVVFTAATNLAVNVTSGAAAGKGLLEFAAVDGHVINANLGADWAHRLKQVDIKGNTALKAGEKVFATKTVVAANKTLSTEAGAEIHGKLEGGNRAVLDVTGNLILDGNGAATITGGFDAVELTAADTLTIKQGDVTSAQGLKMTGSTLTVGESGNVTVAKITLDDDGSKIVAKGNNVTVTEFAGDKKLLEVTLENGDANLATKGLKAIDKVDFKTAQTLTLTSVAAKELEGLNISASGDKADSLTFAGGNALTLKKVTQDKWLDVATGDGTILGQGQTLQADDFQGTWVLSDDSTLEGTQVTGNVTQTGAAGAASTIKGDVQGNLVLSVPNSTVTVNGTYDHTGAGTHKVSATELATLALDTAKDANMEILGGSDDDKLKLDLKAVSKTVKLKTNNVRAANINLQGNTKLEVTDNLSGATITADSDDHKVIAKTAQTFGDATNGIIRTLGTADRAINLEVDNAAGVNIGFAAVNATHYVNLTTSTDNKNTVSLASIPTPNAHVKVNGSIGTSSKKFATVTFGDNAVYTGEAFATTFKSSAAADDVTLENATLHGEYDLQALAGKLRLNNSTLDKLSNAGHAQAAVYVSGTSYGSDDWGTNAAKVQLVEVKENAKLIMADGKNLHATKLDLKKGARWFIGADTTMAGVTMASGAAVNTNASKLTVGTGNTYVDGAGFAIGVTASKTGNMSYGELVFNAASMTEIRGKTLTIVAEASAETNDYAAGKVAFDQVVDVSALSKPEQDEFKAAFRVNLDGKDVITYTEFKNDVEAGAAGAPAPAPAPATPKEVARVAKLVEAATKAGINVAKLVPAAVTSTEKVREAQARTLTAEKSSSAAAAMTMAGVTDAVSNAASMAVDTRIAAAAAGDDSIPYGAWLSAIGGQATQKATSKTPVGYKSNVFGGTLGWDAEVAEGTMVGLAGTYAKGNVKLKDSKVGDKADTKTMMVNLYAQQNISDDMFVQAMVGYAQTDVKAKSKRVLTNTTYETVNSKYKVKGYSAKLLGGYSMAVGNGVSFTPMAGVKFGKLDQGSVTEKGATTNMASSVKHKNKITGVVGARVATVVDSGNMVLTPEAHAFLDYNLGSKKAAVSKIGLASDSARVSQTIEHASKYAVNVGTSLTAKSGMMEYGVGYDASIAKKYVGHQGSLKVRVNF